MSNCRIREPGDTKIIANISAEYYENAGEIAEGLARQLTCPILWQKCMEKLIADGVGLFYEIGPGRVLTGLMKRIDRKKTVINVRDRECIERLPGS
ncbi:MAG: ACP S-malonyltransferase [Planctomycetota bacterium]